MDDFIYFYTPNNNPELNIPPDKTLEIFPELNKIISSELDDIFLTAHNTKDEKILHDLQSKLREILKRLPLHSKSSPDGNHHIVFIKDMCILINVYGIYYLFSNFLFYEGELEISNYHWIEKDSLVVLDLHYIVHDLEQKCICHFDRNDHFVYFTESKKIERTPCIAPPINSVPKYEFQEWNENDCW